MFGPEQRPERRAILWIVSTVVGFGGGILLYPKKPAPVVADVSSAAPDEAAYNPWGKAPPPPAPGAVSAPRRQVLARDGSGQFHLDATVNGRTIRFLVDTGADVVALTPQSAQAVGLDVLPGDYKPLLRTASGMGMAAVVSLDSVAVSGLRLENQRAVVAQGLSENLLGQSVLRRLGRVELQGDTMVLVPN